MRVLQYAIRPAPVLKYFGQLCIALAIVTLVPMIVSLLFGDYHVGLRYGIVIMGFLFIGYSLARVRAPKGIQTNEAMVVITLVFLLSPLATVWPVMASGLGFLDAFFETVSAVTTTGLSTIETLLNKPNAFLFSRAWMQWVGGLGIVVLSLAVMMQPGLVAKRLDIEEDYENDLVGSTRTNSKRILSVYAILTIFGVLFLGALGNSWFESILYTLSAVSTGGFSPHDASLNGIESHYIQFMVIMLSMAGGISLVLYHRAYRNGLQTIRNDLQIKGFLTAGLLTTLLMAWCLWYQDGFQWTEALRHGALHALSAQSTAGFSSMDLSTIGNGSKLTLIFAMAVGGSIGSTAGGIKIFRLMIVFRLIFLIVQRAGMPPNAVSEIRMSGNRLETTEIQNALSLIVLYIVCIGLSWMPFLVLDHSPIDSLFEVVSALSTTGISVGITVTALHPLLKGVLIADMLLGRLEIVAWIVFLYPRTWIGRRMEE